MSWGNVEDITGTHFNDAAVLHCSGRLARHDHTNMLHVAHGRPECSPNIHRPFPSWLIGSSANCHAANLDQLELSFRKCSDLIRLLKTLQNNIQHCEVSDSYRGQTSPEGALEESPARKRRES